LFHTDRSVRSRSGAAAFAERLARAIVAGPRLESWVDRSGHFSGNEDGVRQSQPEAALKTPFPAYRKKIVW
jgi:hypothetical protein